MSAQSTSSYKRTDWLVGALIGLAGSVYVFKDWLLAGAPANKLFADPGDPALMHWITAWVYHTVFQRGDPANFWNANQFYPNAATLAYSDNLAGLQLVYAPLRLLNASPLPALYLSLIAVCIVGAMLTFVALRRVGDFTLLEAMLMTFAAHFTLGVTAFFAHYQLFAFQLAPAVLLHLFAYLRDFRRRNLLMVCVVSSFAVSIAGYFAPMVGLVGIVAGGAAFIVQARLMGLKALLRCIGWPSVALVAITGIVLYALQLAPYIELNRSIPVQPIGETARFSAGLLALARSFSPYSTWYRPVSDELGSWEYSNFPGVLLLLGGILFTASTIAATLRRRALKRAPISLVAYLWIVFGASVLFSWGPVLKTLPSIHLPLYYVGFIVPGVSRIRAPGRFGLLMALPLAVMLVIFVRGRLHGRMRALAMALMLTFVAVESLPRFSLYDFAVDPSGDHATLAQYVPEGEPVLMLPVYTPNAYWTILLATEQLTGSTLNWVKLPVGYGSAVSPQYRELLALDETFQNGKATADSMVAFAKKYKIHTIFVQRSRYSPEVNNAWNNLLSVPNIDVIFQDEKRMILQLTDAG